MQNHRFQYAKKCKMIIFKSLSMTSLHVDLNEAAKCDDIWPNLRSFINQFMKVRGIKTWKELMIVVQLLVRLLFNNNFINPGLVL